MHNDRTTVGGGSGGDAYGTPDSLYASLASIFRFTIDLAADHWSAKAPLYCTLEGTFGKCVRSLQGECVGIHHTFGGARDRHSWMEDCPGYVKISDAHGLEVDWLGEHPFCNPPFSQVAKWVAMFDRMRNVEGAFPAVTILPEARDTTWWVLHVKHRSLQSPQSPRTRFIHPPYECEPGCALPKPPRGAKADGVTTGKGHALGQPAGSPPGGISIVEFRPDWLLP